MKTRRLTLMSLIRLGFKEIKSDEYNIKVYGIYGKTKNWNSIFDPDNDKYIFKRTKDDRHYYLLIYSLNKKCAYFHNNESFLFTDLDELITACQLLKCEITLEKINKTPVKKVRTTR